MAVATQSSDARKESTVVVLVVRISLRHASTSATIPRSIGSERPISAPSTSTWMYLHPDDGSTEPSWPPRNIPVRTPRKIIRSGGDILRAGR